MSTRSQWSFREKGKQIALIYKHSDGYPQGFYGGFALWKRFTDKIIKDEGMYGNRFDDAEYLAARFIVFLAIHENKEKNLNFGGIGISKDLHGDIEYLYEINCDNSEFPAFRCKSIYRDEYVNEHNLTMSKHGIKPKGSITIKNKTYNSLNDVKVPFTKQNITVTKPVIKKQCSNDSYTKLKRDSNGKFIKMDDIVEFEYPHNGVNTFRQVKVVFDANNCIEGIQLNGENTGYKRFNKSKISGLFQYKGYADNIK